MSLREFLIASGIDPKDLSQAVKSSRELTQTVEFWSGLASDMLRKAMPAKSPKVKRVLSAILTQTSTVNYGAGKMLGKRR